MKSPLFQVLILSLLLVSVVGFQIGQHASLVSAGWMSSFKDNAIESVDTFGEGSIALVALPFSAASELGVIIGAAGSAGLACGVLSENIGGFISVTADAAENILCFPKRVAAGIVNEVIEAFYTCGSSTNCGGRCPPGEVCTMSTYESEDEYSCECRDPYGPTTGGATTPQAPSGPESKPSGPTTGGSNICKDAPGLTQEQLAKMYDQLIDEHSTPEDYDMVNNARCNQRECPDKTGPLGCMMEGKCTGYIAVGEHGEDKYGCECKYDAEGCSTPGPGSPTAPSGSGPTTTGGGGSPPGSTTPGPNSPVAPGGGGGASEGGECAGSVDTSAAVALMAGIKGLDISQLSENDLVMLLEEYCNRKYCPVTTGPGACNDPPICEYDISAVACKCPECTDDDDGDDTSTPSGPCPLPHDPAEAEPFLVCLLKEGKWPSCPDPVSPDGGYSWFCADGSDPCSQFYDWDETDKLCMLTPYNKCNWPISVFDPLYPTCLNYNFPVPTCQYPFSFGDLLLCGTDNGEYYHVCPDGFGWDELNKLCYILMPDEPGQDDTSDDYGCTDGTQWDSILLYCMPNGTTSNGSEDGTGKDSTDSFWDTLFDWLT
ncbi:MAG: hypothetical protein V1776_02995 [Candidatus Diapherotrites archaeon]